jgi:hypothetical protein
MFVSAKDKRRNTRIKSQCSMIFSLLPGAESGVVTQAFPADAGALSTNL